MSRLLASIIDALRPVRQNSEPCFTVFVGKPVQLGQAIMVSLLLVNEAVDNRPLLQCYGGTV